MSFDALLQEIQKLRALLAEGKAARV